MSENSKVEEVVLSKHDFYFETPIYEVVELKLLEKGSFSGDVDAFGAKNGSDTTYGVNAEEIDVWWKHPSNIGFYLITLTCKRKNDDTIRFVVYKDHEIALKIGQWPSLADLQYAEIGKKYDKVLPEEDLRNLKKAIGLAANGVGAGSFVYLRRIFENLIQETFDNAGQLGVTLAVFKTTRMEDKVELLKAHLPSQLVEMKVVYGILSKGVHELSEDECLRYFAPLKLSIELILDQKIEEKKKKDKDAEVKKQLQAITQELGAVKKESK